MTIPAGGVRSARFAVKALIRRALGPAPPGDAAADLLSTDLHGATGHDAGTLGRGECCREARTRGVDVEGLCGRLGHLLDE